MSRPELAFKEYSNAIMSEIRRLMEVGVVLQNKEPEQNNRIFRFDLPSSGIARLRDRIDEELIVDKYVNTIHENGRWGILFKDHSVAMLSFQLDADNSGRDEVVPASFCYVFAAPSRTVGRATENAHFFRIEMHPDESGNLLGEPVVHLHGNRNKTPRFGLSPATSPLVFLDFVVRNRFPHEWTLLQSDMSITMTALHHSFTAEAARYKINNNKEYLRLANHLELLEKQRKHNIPIWKAPPTERRYPFLL